MYSVSRETLCSFLYVHTFPVRTRQVLNSILLENEGWNGWPEARDPAANQKHAPPFLPGNEPNRSAWRHPRGKAAVAEPESYER